MIISGFEANKIQFKTHCFVYKQSKMGHFNYIVLHYIDFDDVNFTISPFDMPSPAEFKGHPHLAILPAILLATVLLTHPH